MPVQPRPLYPANRRALGARLGFARAGVQACGPPHLVNIRCHLVDTIAFRTTRVVLSAAHRDHDPANTRLRNLRALCQRCHLRHDRPHHRIQRQLTCRSRYALATCSSGRISSGDADAAFVHRWVEPRTRCSCRQPV